jgi:2-methylaconitate cis-trans-isomerase PrpF
MARLEPMRLEAGRRMGLGDVTGKVIPKIGMLAPPRKGGALLSRYFTPDTPHPSHAVTGGVAVAVASRVPGTVAAAVADADAGDGNQVLIEHAAGALAITLDVDASGDGAPRVDRAGVVRTVRPIFTGKMYIAHAIDAANAD